MKKKTTLQEIEQIGVFKICLSAEQTLTTVHTYRDKLVHLRKLDHSIMQNQLPIGPYKKVSNQFSEQMCASFKEFS